MFRLTLLFFLITSILFAQESDDIVGKVKRVREKIFSLEKKSKLKETQSDKLIRIGGQYGEFGLTNPKLTQNAVKFDWQKTPDIYYKKSTKNYNFNGKLMNETWYFLDKSIARKFEYSYNEKDSLLQLKKISRSGSYVIYNKTYNYYNYLSSEFISSSDNPNFPNFQFLKYDSNNNLIKIQRYSADNGYENSTIYKYNNSNKKISESQHFPYIYFKNSNNPKSDSIGTTFLRKKYIYDEDKLIEIQYFSSDYYNNKIFHKKLFKYDSENNLIEEISFDVNENRITFTVQYSYNDKKQIIKEIKTFNNIYKDFSEPTDYEEKEYFFENDRLSKLIYKNKAVSNIITFAYKFDKKGNWIQQTKSVDGKPLYIWERKIEYYKE